MIDIESCDVMLSNLYTRYKRRCELPACHFYLFAPDHVSSRCSSHSLLKLALHTSNVREIPYEEAAVLSVMAL